MHMCTQITNFPFLLVIRRSEKLPFSLLLVIRRFEKSSVAVLLVIRRSEKLPGQKPCTMQDIPYIAVWVDVPSAYIAVWVDVPCA